MDDKLPPDDPKSKLERLTGRLAAVTVQHELLTADLNNEVNAIKADYAEPLEALAVEIRELAEHIRQLTGENFDEVFGESKSVAFSTGTLSSRSVAGKENLDEAALLEAARKGGFVRQLFDPYVSYSLKPNFDKWFARHPEHQDAVNACYVLTPPYESVTFKRNLAALGYDPERLSDRPVKIGRLELTENEPR